MVKAAQAHDAWGQTPAEDTSRTHHYNRPHISTIQFGVGDKLEAIQLSARTEALIIDPVYTAKAATAMIDHIGREIIPRDATVVFLYTGGTPALFTYHAEVASALKKVPAEAGLHNCPGLAEHQNSARSLSTASACLTTLTFDLR